MKAKKITMWLVAILVVLGVVWIAQNKKPSDESNGDEKQVAGETRYENENPRFSFPYDKEAKATKIDNGDGAAIISVRNNLATGNEFQIAVTPEEDSSPLTIERIKNDLPDLKTFGARNISVADTQAVTFTISEGGQSTVEVWFVRDGWLYQITAYDNAESRAMAEKAVADWKF